LGEDLTDEILRLRTPTLSKMALKRSRTVLGVM